MISLAGCMPYTAALDFQAVASITQEVLPGAGPLALQSGGQGLPALRERLVKIVRAEGVPAHPTTWLSRMEAKALDLVAKLFCDPGDVVLAEGPSYVGAIGAFSAYQSQLLHAPMDAEGLVPEGSPTRWPGCRAAVGGRSSCSVCPTTTTGRRELVRTQRE